MQRCCNKVEKEAVRTISGMEDPMKCITDSLNKGSIDSDPKKSGKVAMEGCTKKKVGPVSSKGKNAAADPPAAEAAAAGGTSMATAAGGTSMGEKVALATAAGGTPMREKVAVTMAIGGGIDAEEWVPGQLIELPKHYVEWILSQKRHVLEEDPDEFYNRMINDPDRPDFLEEQRQIMRDLAEQYKATGDRLEKFQEWVRTQLKEKGRVLVDDTYLAQRAAYCKAFKEEMGNLWSDV